MLRWLLGYTHVHMYCLLKRVSSIDGGGGKWMLSTTTAAASGVHLLVPLDWIDEELSCDGAHGADLAT